MSRIFLLIGLVATCIGSGLILFDIFSHAKEIINADEIDFDK